MGFSTWNICREQPVDGRPESDTTKLRLTRKALSLSVGYELQEYDQLVTCETTNFLAQYVEDISNHALTASIGFTF